MPQWDWGPIPAFAARLAATVPRRPNGRRRPLVATRPFGGPWGLLVRDLWTSGFPPIKTPGPRWRVALDDLLRRGPNGASAFASDDELAPVLADVHRFLVLRNVRFLAEVLPGPAAIPRELLGVSATGLAQSLWVYELATHGIPNARRVAVPVGEPDWPGPVTAGDCLSLHLWIEDLVAADDLKDPPAESPRIAGGLRQATFLRRFPLLAQSKDPTARQRDAVVRLLLKRSPLSQWVYPDLVPPVPEVERVAAVATLGKGDLGAQPVTQSASASLFARRASEGPTTDGAESHRVPDPHVLCLRGGLTEAKETESETAAARDGWHSLLARSLLASLLGPTAVWERRVAAEDRLAAVRNAGLGSSTLVARKQAYAAAEDARQEAQVQGIVRPVRLGELLTRAGAAGTLIGMRMLDMLARHLVQLAAPLLLRDQAADRDRPPLSRLVMSPGNRVFRRLTESLFGGARVPDLDSLSPAHAAVVERLVVPLLPTDGALPVLAEAAGVTVEQARRVRDRFTRVPVTLPHPIRDGHPVSPTPAQLLAAWCQSMKPQDFELEPDEPESDDPDPEPPEPAAPSPA